jgi:peptide/nickel transport system permease protein
VTRVGWALLALMAAVCVFGEGLALHPATRGHRDHVLAPPMPVHVRDVDGRWAWPHVHPWRLADRISRTYEADGSRPIALRAAVTRPSEWFPLGTDSLGRDVWSRLVLGARVSLGLSLTGCTVALLLGISVGAIAGYAGGLLDTVLMRACEFVMVLPALYVVLSLRAALPLDLPAQTLFTAMAAVLAVAGSPQVARAARAVIVVERERDYVEAARAAGATHARILVRHLLPSCGSVLLGQALLLLPSFVLAESTLSFIGLGFDPAVPSWGTMLQEAASIRAVSEYPWVLAPAGALAYTVLAFNLVADGRRTSPLP